MLWLVVDLDARTRQVLTLLLQAGSATTAELTRLLGRRHTQSTSYSLKTLERRGWAAKDGRLWRVTEAGRAQLDPLVRFVPAHDPAAGTAAALLEALGSEPLTTSEVAARAGVERSNAHRRLETLERLGRVTRAPGRPTRWRRS